MNNPLEANENFWHLLPSVTPDTELRKVLKSNFTVAKIVEGIFYLLNVMTFCIKQL